MLDFLGRLFDPAGFPPRWYCGEWTDAHGWLHILSDLGVWSAYVAIPCVLGFFVLRKRDIPFRAIFILFGLFILACGTTHLMEAIIFWWPVYRLAGVIKLLTALVSWGTVFALVPVAPRVLAMRCPDELQREIEARERAETALLQANVELKERIEALRSSEERFRLLVDGTQDHALYLLDADGRISSWNSGAERVNQYRADEIIGRSFTAFYTPEDVDAGRPAQQLQRAAAEGRAEDVGWRVRKDGSRFWADTVVTTLRDDTGRLRGFSKITRDITARKEAEEHARRLAEEASARRATEATLVEAARRKDEFLALLSHELRNPLAPILHAVHLLHRKADEPALVVLARDMIERQARQMSRLVDDLLDASRIARGKVELKLAPLDLAALARTAVGDQRAELEKAGLTVVLDLPCSPVWIRGDAARLTQIVGNLLSNARKYTDAGGHVTVRLTPHERVMRLSVEDTGVGIPPESVTRLFEAFTQLEAHRERSAGGLGLGLAVVKGLAELHGGTARVHSDGPGRGSTFTIELPLAAAPGSAAATPPAEPAPSRPLRVLVVDDNVDGATSLSLLLRLAGYQVEVAHDGPAALEVAERFHPEVALLDIGLPHGMDGYEVARRLRAQPGNGSVLPIALTGYGQEADQRHSQAAGFWAHLIKPVQFTVLQELLGRLRQTVG